VDKGTVAPADGTACETTVLTTGLLAALGETLATLTEADRLAIVEHVAALAKLSPAKRAAILTLTADN
jgi:hypothetical protein